MKKKIKSELNNHIKEIPKMQKLLHKRRVLYTWLRIFFGIFLISLIIGSIVFLRTRAVQIYSINVSGNQIIDSDLIVADVQKSLSGKYFFLIPKTNIFFYPKNLVIKNLAKDFPRLNKINVSLVGKKNLEVGVTEENGVALWCGADNEVPDLTSQCYFTDNFGKIIDIAPYYSGDVYLRFFGGTISQTNPLGSTFVDAQNFNNIINFANNIESLNLQISAVRLTSSGDDYFLIDLGGGKNAYIQFHDNDNYDILFSNLKAAIQKTSLVDQLKNDKTNLQYFDLRFTNKVYYKFSDTAGTTQNN